MRTRRTSPPIARALLAAATGLGIVMYAACAPTADTASSSAEACAAPTVTGLPESVRAGDLVTLASDNWLPCNDTGDLRPETKSPRRVTVAWEQPAGRSELTELAVPAGGLIQGTISIPADAAPGPATLHFESDAALSISVSVTVAD